MVDAVKIPVTVKTRLGWDADHKIIVDLAEQLQDCGIAALAIHGRTRAQMYTGEADWTLPEPNVSEYSQELLQQARDFSDTAVVVLARVGGEANDLPPI